MFREMFIKIQSLFGNAKIIETENCVAQLVKEPSEKELLLLEKAKNEDTYIKEVKYFIKKVFDIEIFENTELTRLDVRNETNLETKDKKVTVFVEMKESCAFVRLLIGVTLGCKWKLTEKNQEFFWEEIELGYYSIKISTIEKIRKILYLTFAPECFLEIRNLELDKDYNKVKFLLENKYKISLQNFEGSCSNKQLEAIYEILLENQTLLNSDQEIIDIVEYLYSRYAILMIKQQHNQIKMIMSI